jgi:hypothetical protein
VKVLFKVKGIYIYIYPKCVVSFFINVLYVYIFYIFTLLLLFLCLCFCHVGVVILFACPYSFYRVVLLSHCVGVVALVVFVATPLWPSVGVKPNTSKVGDLESSGTPECLEFDTKALNTSHWGVLGVIGKVLKRRYRKWPRIGHLDICSPSYGQKKGRESN